jgi:hypothetical protein
MSLIITEYAGVGPGNIQAPIEPALADQEIAIGAEGDSAALNVNTRLVRLYAEAACHVKFGTAPTATTAMQPLAAGVPEFRWVQGQPGTMKISVIAA